MAVTAEQVLENTGYLIPEQNALPPDRLLIIAQSIIDKYGDDDENLGKIYCEFLKSVGVQNKAISNTSSGSLKREKLGQHEIEYFDGAKLDWDGYITSIKNDICPLLFGVSEPVAYGAKINSKEKTPVISPYCGIDSDLYL